MFLKIAYKLYVWLRGVLGIKSDIYERPVALKSHTVRKRTSCGTVYITVAVDCFGDPREIFFQAGSEGCIANQEAVGRVCSLCLRYNVPLNELIDQLQKCHCGQSMKKLGKLENQADKDHAHRKEYVKSCADAVVRAIKEVCK